MNEVIKTDKLSIFCGGCNNTVELKRFIQVDESQTIEEVMSMIDKNESDSLFCRKRYMGFCLCGNVWVNK